MAQPPAYMYNIPSIHESNGGMSAILVNLDLNRAIQAGDPIQPQNLIHAKSIAKKLKAIHGDFRWDWLNNLFTFLFLQLDGQITAAVAESAELRAAAVEAARVLLYSHLDFTHDFLDKMCQQHILQLT